MTAGLLAATMIGYVKTDILRLDNISTDEAIKLYVWTNGLTSKCLNFFESKSHSKMTDFTLQAQRKSLATPMKGNILAIANRLSSGIV